MKGARGLSFGGNILLLQPQSQATRGDGSTELREGLHIDVQFKCSDTDKCATNTKLSALARETRARP